MMTGMLYLALSCFQGRPMGEAARTLMALAPGKLGLQLTPGCAPSPIDVDCPQRTHHGFTPHALRARVWNAGKLVWHGDSLHPPLRKHVDESWQPPENGVLETMYPGYADLSNGEEIEAAMAEGRSIAVDIAHLGIQMHMGVLSADTLEKLLDYERVAEVHVSTSHNGKDTHAAVTVETWGLEWARERMNHGTPVILECYMHKLSDTQRREQVAMLLP